MLNLDKLHKFAVLNSVVVSKLEALLVCLKKLYRIVNLNYHTFSVWILILFSLLNPPEMNSCKIGSLPIHLKVNTFTRWPHTLINIHIYFRLPRKTDMERKVEIVQFASRTRQLFIRLLALVKWASSATKVDKCSVSMAVYTLTYKRVFTVLALVKVPLH